jgi:hypothetical protein
MTLRDLAVLSTGKPLEPTTVYTSNRWTLELVRLTRDAHPMGEFASSALLADAIVADADVFGALGQRLGPLVGAPREVIAGDGKGRGIFGRAKEEAERLVATDSAAMLPGTLESMFRHTAFMGFSVAQIREWIPREDGSFVDPVVEPWPLGATWKDLQTGKLWAFTKNAGTVEIVHGDGRWIVFEPHGPDSFKMGAIRPLALLWVDRQFAMRDRSNRSAADAAPTPTAIMPEGIQPRSDQGRELLTTLRMLQNPKAGGAFPFGTTLGVFEGKLDVSQIFENIINSGARQVAKALVGQDATADKGTVYTAPVFEGVRWDILTAETREAAAKLESGLLRPWSLINFGRVDVRPSLRWCLPDPRTDERRDAKGKAHEAFGRAIAWYDFNGFELDDDRMKDLAKDFGLEAPKRTGKGAAAAGAKPPSPPIPGEPPKPPAAP